MAITICSKTSVENHSPSNKILGTVSEHFALGRLSQLEVLPSDQRRTDYTRGTTQFHDQSIV